MLLKAADTTSVIKYSMINKDSSLCSLSWTLVVFWKADIRYRTIAHKNLSLFNLWDYRWRDPIEGVIPAL